MTDTPHSANTDVPSVARAYDFVLGGKDNFDVDRQFAESIMERDPEIAVSAKLNKEFGRRVTDYMARQGVRQFLDLGSGIPTSPPSVHDTARRIVPDARVVYVDHDPVVIAHNRALRSIGPGLAVILESFLEPDGIFAHPELVGTLDLGRPIGVLILSVLQNTYEDEFVKEVLEGIRRHLVPGSFLAISHVSDRTPQVYKDQLSASAAKYGYPRILLRTDEQLESFFTGFELVEPGVVDYRDWHADEAGDEDRPEINTLFTGAVGRLV